MNECKKNSFVGPGEYMITYKNDSNVYLQKCVKASCNRDLLNVMLEQFVDYDIIQITKI